MWQVRAQWADSEDGSAPRGHGDSQEYATHRDAIENALLWAALILSQGHGRVVVLDEGTERACLDSEAEALEMYNLQRGSASWRRQPRRAVKAAKTAKKTTRTMAKR
jgi:hypothetical protein